MKLPFNMFLTPLLKPYMSQTRLFCRQPTFTNSILYTYCYGTLGFLISANHLRKHLGEIPSQISIENVNSTFMLIHDFKIIATSMGLVQHACLLAGCFTECPALFLPHLAGQTILVVLKLVNIMLSIANISKKSFNGLGHKVSSLLLMIFNWLQEFCVFRQYLCICDL